MPCSSVSVGLGVGLPGLTTVDDRRQESLQDAYTLSQKTGPKSSASKALHTAPAHDLRCDEPQKILPTRF
jgi:hypothetical protein